MTARLVSYIRRRHKYLWFVTIGGIFQTLFMGPALGLYGPIEIYNTSPSVPVGRYWYTLKWPPERGDIVMVRNPPGFNLNWLLKRVTGVGGDVFCWRASEMRHYVNDQPMTPIPAEAVAAEMPIWRGCRSLDEDELVGFGDHFLAYSSAYYGPVKLGQLWGVYRLQTCASVSTCW